MKAILTLAFASAALLAGCGEATVQGTGGAKLSLSKPSGVTIVRGGMSKSDIKISRHDLTGEVSISFAKLPNGVDVVEGSQKTAGDNATFTLRASATADLVKDYASEVTATGPGGVAVTQPIDITVKDK